MKGSVNKYNNNNTAAGTLPTRRKTRKSKNTS